MHARERAIRERLAERVCRRCEARYTPVGITVLARRRTAWLVMVTCGRCDRQAIFVATFPGAHSDAPIIHADEPHLLKHSFPPTLPQLSASSAQPPRLLPSPSPLGAGSPITRSDVDAMREFLDHFDGDFRTLFVRRNLADGSSF